jgi:hypothetical protein
MGGGSPDPGLSVFLFRLPGYPMQWQECEEKRRATCGGPTLVGGGVGVSREGCPYEGSGPAWWASHALSYNVYYVKLRNLSKDIRHL